MPLGKKNHMSAKSTSDTISAILRTNTRETYLAFVCSLPWETEQKQRGCVGTMTPCNGNLMLLVLDLNWNLTVCFCIILCCISKNTLTWARHGGAYLSSQHSGGRGRRLSNSRLVWDSIPKQNKTNDSIISKHSIQLSGMFKWAVRFVLEIKVFHPKSNSRNTMNLSLKAWRCKRYCLPFRWSLPASPGWPGTNDSSASAS